MKRALKMGLLGFAGGMAQEYGNVLQERRVAAENERLARARMLEQQSLAELSKAGKTRVIESNGTKVTQEYTPYEGYSTIAESPVAREKTIAPGTRREEKRGNKFVTYEYDGSTWNEVGDAPRLGQGKAPEPKAPKTMIQDIDGVPTVMEWAPNGWQPSMTAEGAPARPPAKGDSGPTDTQTASLNEKIDEKVQAVMEQARKPGNAGIVARYGVPPGTPPEQVEELLAEYFYGVLTKRRDAPKTPAQPTDKFDPKAFLSNY